MANHIKSPTGNHEPDARDDRQASERMPSPVMNSPTHSNCLAQALGVFGISLGIIELFAPRFMARMTGVHHPALLQLFGLREIATGIGILGSNRPTEWVWGRVAGDLMDLAALARAESAEPAKVAGIAVLGATALDMICALQLTAAELLENTGKSETNHH